MAISDLWFSLTDSLLWSKLRSLMARLSLTAKVMIGGCVVFVIALTVAVFYVDQVETSEHSLPPALETESTLAAPTTTIARIVVHVAGAVRQPGVYSVAKNGRIADAITLADGPTAFADINKINLAQPLADGMRIEVPAFGQTGSISAGSNPEGGGSPLLDLNTATAAQLEHLSGIGPATAKAIVTYREQHGDFQSVDELLKVKGIGPSKLAQFRDSLLVH